MPSERLGEPSSNGSLLGRAVRPYAVVILAGLLVGALVAPYAVSVARPEEPEPDTIAVIPLDGSIDGTTATGVTEQIDRARDDPDVVAIVLVSNSPGGAAFASEEMYLKLQRVSQEMPVVTSIGAAAASGAYFAAAPTDYIYAKPASIVGSVGTLAMVPQKIEPTSIVAASGPSKLSDDSRRSFYYRLETVQNSFVNAVMKHRGDELRINEAELAEAGVYTGQGAVDAGLADAIGGTDRAVARAASLAGADRYRVERFQPNVTSTFISRANYLASSRPDDRKRIASPTYLTGLGGNASTYGNVLMIPPQYVVPARGDDAGDASADTTVRVEVANGTS